MGRPSSYSAAVADKICERLANGETLVEICRAEGMPAESTVRLWVTTNREGFSAMYARAREAQMDYFAEEILSIADDATNDWMERQGETSAGYDLNGEHLQRSRLRIDARKWLMSKLAPKTYGDKQQLEVAGKDGAPLTAVLNVTIGSEPESSSEAG